MKNKPLFVIVGILLFLVSGCVSNNTTEKSITNVALIDGYKKQEFVNLEYQIPVDYNSIKVSDTVSKSEKELDIYSFDNTSKLKVIVVVGVSDINDYRNDSQFLYELSQYIDGNKNEMFTYYMKKINGAKWRTGDTYMSFLEEGKEIGRYQVNVAVHQDDDKYYGILFAFPNGNAGKSLELEYPEFEEAVKNVFSSLVIR